MKGRHLPALLSGQLVDKQPPKESEAQMKDISYMYVSTAEWVESVG